MADIEDQTSTALVRDCENGKLSPRHSGHVNTCFVDGHVSRVYQDTIKFKGELISTIKIEQRSRYSVDETISFSDLTPLRNCYERLLSPEELNALQQDRTRQDLLKTMIRNLMSENWKVELGAIPSSGSCLLQNATISRHLEGRIGNNQWDYDSPVAAEVVWSRSYMDYTYHSPVTKFPDIVLVYNTDKSKIHVEMPPYSFKGASQSSVETVTNPTKNERGNPIDKCVVKLPPPGKLLYLSCWRYLPALFHNPFINTLFIQLIKKPFLYIIGVIGLVFSENFRKFILLPIATKLWNLFLRIFKLQTMGT